MIAGSSSTALPALTPSVTVNATTTVRTGGSPDWHGRIAMCRWATGDNRVIAVYQNSSAHATNDGALHITFNTHATVAAASWTANDTKPGGGAVSGFPMTPTGAAAGQDAGEGMLIEDPRTGRIHLFIWRVDYNVDNDGTQHAYSDDGGETWSTPVAIAVSGVTNLTLTYATDQAFFHPNTGDLYMVTREYTTGTYTASKIHLIKSAAGADVGDAFEMVFANVMASNQGGNGGIEASLTYLGGEGDLLVVIRDTDHQAAWQRISRDLGASWGTLTDVTSQIGRFARARVYTVAQLRGLPGGWNDNRLIGVGFQQDTPGDSQDRTNGVILGWWDRNGGTVTWSQFDIDTSAEDGGYGDIVWSGSGLDFVVGNYKGTLAASDWEQYDLTAAWRA